MPVISTTTLQSPLGPLFAAATDEGLCMLEFADESRLAAQTATLNRWFQADLREATNDHLDGARAQLVEYFAGRRAAFELSLVIRGTPFQERVWNELLAIPFGVTCSYSELAERIGRPGAQRAVGLANGKNRIAIIIPCHRVIERSGGLRGYGGGVWRKRFLLDLEGGMNPAPMQLTLV